MDLLAQIEAVVAAADFGKASAVKRGRNPEFPYVPVVVRETRTQNLSGRVAYRTREEAVATAQRQIDFARANLAKQLASRGCRALRRSYGLPEEVG